MSVFGGMESLMLKKLVQTLVSKMSPEQRENIKGYVDDSDKYLKYVPDGQLMIVYKDSYAETEEESIFIIPIDKSKVKINEKASKIQATTVDLGVLIKEAAEEL